MPPFSIATAKPLSGFIADDVVKITPTGSTHNSFGDFAASGEAVRILIDTDKVKNAGDAHTAVERLLDDLRDRATKGAWPLAATP